MNHLAIVARDDARDHIPHPLSFAHSQAQAGAEVNMPFVLWAVPALTPEDAASLAGDPGHAPGADWLRAQRPARRTRRAT